MMWSAAVPKQTTCCEGPGGWLLFPWW
jgi:hypothetical protein